MMIWLNVITFTTRSSLMFHTLVRLLGTSKALSRAVRKKVRGLNTMRKVSEKKKVTSRTEKRMVLGSVTIKMVGYG